jgi:D-serine deaminase-like pyridoxal phosphate-dependent protein
MAKNKPRLVWRSHSICHNGLTMYSAIPEEPYRIADLTRVMTPALAIYPEIVDANIDATLRLLGGNAGRWRPHVKTAKLGYTMRRLAQRGVRAAKCATTLELIAACEAGMNDVLLAYSVVGANAARVREIASEHPETKVSVLVETPEQAATWTGTGIGVFLDVNPGMNRTGVEQDHMREIVSLARATNGNFRGLHYYDGHMHIDDAIERQRAAWAGYDKLMDLVEACESGGAHVGEVITSGTPALPCGAAYPRFKNAVGFVHRVSPGTVVYNDATSLEQLSGLGYQAAAVVIASVVSHPIAHRFTCDAGHKAVSADAGVPTCVVAGHPAYQPQKPSEEHLPVDVPGSGAVPAIGRSLYLVPRHVCPTVNNFDHALIVENGRITSVEPVTARGRERAIR